jgi:LDH2 family malate/lactate/ureidoglycolate dehydrogenase
MNALNAHAIPPAGNHRLALDEADALARAVLCGLGYRPDEAAAIADHLIEAELRGMTEGGLSRLLSIAERLTAKGFATRPLSVARETAVSARIDGHDNIGYLVAQRATEIAIEKAAASGIAIVGANDTWYTGILAYYAEQATRRDLVFIMASNATAWVAPHGGTERRLGTNPICFGFPSDTAPIILDISTASITHAHVLLASRLGEELPEGAAFAPDGTPTRDPAAALNGAFTTWGGHRGSGLAVVVQLLGMLGGSPMIPAPMAQFGLTVIALRPDLLTDLADFKREVAGFAAALRATRPVPGGGPIRLPFERSYAERARRRQAGHIDVNSQILDRIQALRNRAAGVLR